MPRKTDAEVIAEVTEKIEEAIAKNRRHEAIIVLVLLTLFITGLTLVFLGALAREWMLVVPGGFLQITIVFPIRGLIKLREDNMRLQILPQLMRLADSKTTKVLAARLVQRLINQVPK